MGTLEAWKRGLWRTWTIGALESRKGRIYRPGSMEDMANGSFGGLGE
jgi:hypothetical protein